MRFLVNLWLNLSVFSNMDFNSVLSRCIVSIIVVLQRIFLLIMYPYKTMRKISFETDYFQIILLFGCVCVYFYFANILRQYHYEPIILFILTVFHYLGSVLFFHFIATIFSKDKQLSMKPFLFTLMYSMIPTLIWLGVNSSLYLILPPPRTFSLLGGAFSVVYISFSLAMLVWKVILEYLAIRFASKMPFYQVVYALILYFVMVGPYFFWMYAMNFFRIPII
ncbi:hypothetical protein BH09PAT2_BH09PAT2_03340 [soil metagenome]